MYGSCKLNLKMKTIKPKNSTCSFKMWNNKFMELNKELKYYNYNNLNHKMSLRNKKSLLSSYKEC